MDLTHLSTDYYKAFLNIIGGDGAISNIKYYHYHLIFVKLVVRKI